MTGYTFPTLASGERSDSSKYSTQIEDVATKTNMEGGYVVSRPKFTRLPRKTFNIAYTAMGQTDKLAIEAFYVTVLGGSSIFNWTDPVTNTVYAARFADKVKYTYTGKGNRHLWDVAFMLEEA